MFISVLTRFPLPLLRSCCFRNCTLSQPRVKIKSPRLSPSSMRSSPVLVLDGAKWPRPCRHPGRPGALVAAVRHHSICHVTAFEELQKPLREHCGQQLGDYFSFLMLLCRPLLSTSHVLVLCIQSVLMSNICQRVTWCPAVKAHT